MSVWTKAFSAFCIIYLFIFLPLFSFGQWGKDGNVTISATNSIINQYTQLTADALVGNTTLNVNNSAPFAIGDLVMVIQMQGATITGNVQNNTWGAIANYNNSGNYEFAEVLSVPNSTQITLSCGLEKNYTATGKTQVIRVPRYSVLTVTTTGSITSPAWNGSTGGLVVAESIGNITINGIVQVDGKGFRGGAVDNNSDIPGNNNYYSNNNADGANKGESIAGYDTDYNTYGGSIGRGAPANGGGGGNAHNAGGGGGANGGNIATWNGKGNPATGYNAAWNLEGGAFSGNTSSGGGRGGYTYSNSNQNAATVAPGNTLWGGDNRQNVGGMGGRSLDYTTGKLFFGGGGGAGDANNSGGADGADGGGMIFLTSYANINGTGSIRANGNNGNVTPSPGIDAPGGAGGGGTIVLNASSIVSGVSAIATGGTGGIQVVSSNEAEGPGGGGGGGYIALSNTGIATNVAGGVNGTTNSNQVTEFPPNGATAGGAGSIGNINNFNLTATNDTICKGEIAVLTTTVSGGGAPVSPAYSWWDSQVGGTQLATGSTFTVSPITTTTYYAAVCPKGTYRVPAIVTVKPIPIIAATSDTICKGATATLTASGANSYSWSMGATTAAITVSPLSTTTYTVIGNSLGCLDTTTTTVTINLSPTVNNNAATICIGQSAIIIAGGANSYLWSNGVTTNAMTDSPTTTTTYTVIGSITGGATCPGISTATITVNPLPIISVSTATICKGMGGSATISASGANGYVWNTGENISFITKAPVNTTTYSVTGTSIHGCTGTASGTIYVNPIPVVTATSTTVCVGQAATLTASGADYYSWFNGTTGAAMTDTPPITMTYTVTGTTLGCSSTGTGTITVNPLPTPSSTSATICKGQSATLTASGANSFIWSEGTIGANMTASPTSTTTYTVTGNSLGCTLTAVGTIKVNPIPVITVVPSTVCAGTVGSLQASGANSYVWNTGATSATLATTPLTTTGYTVTGTSLGCSSTRTGTITVNPIPTLSVTNTTICRGQSGTITASTATPGTASYSWATGTSTASLTLSPTYTSVYNVTVSIKGCTKSASGTITVLIAPVVTISHPTICDKQSATVTAYGAKAYTWSTGETTNPIIVSPHVTTTYSVVGLGCPNGTSGTVIVNPNPVISATSATVCQGISATIQVKGADSYMWVTGDTTRQITDVPPTSGIHYYSVVGSTFAGCNDTTKGTITVNPNPKIKVNNDTICPGDFGKLTASGANSYFWTTGSRSNTIQMSPPLTTTYTVTGTTNAGCVGDGTGTIYVSKFPTADFVISPNPTTVFNTEIAFTNKSSVDVVYWHWDFGDGKTLYPNTASPLHTYAAEVGTYTITLIVHNITPCWDTIDYQLYVGPEYAFYIPNCFTPNGDIHNEGFRGRGIGIEQYKLQIFDRWGLNIWQSTNLDESWDGKIKGYDNLVQQDVYVWKVFILDVFGKEHSYVGTVTVLR